MARQTRYLIYAYKMLPKVYQPYKFSVQKIHTNCVEISSIENQKETRQNSPICDLMGLCWDKTNDYLYCKNLSLNQKADTKREILRTIAGNFDWICFHINDMLRTSLHIQLI